MFSTFHIYLSVILFFFTVAVQGSGTTAGTAATAASDCEKCNAGGGAWCVKTLGTEKSKHCATKNNCLGGEMPACDTLKDATATDKTASEAMTCDKCIGLTQTWCIKGAAGAAQIRDCVPTTVAATVCIATEANTKSLTVCTDAQGDLGKRTVHTPTAGGGGGGGGKPTATTTKKPSGAIGASTIGASVFAMLATATLYRQ